MDRQEIIKELRRIIRSKNNDAIKLAWLDQQEVPNIDGLDLRGVVEVKRSEKGAFEVKFADKLKALELLERISAREGDDDLDAFLEGLRDGEGQ